MNRREWLRGAAVVALIPGFARAQAARPLKIGVMNDMSSVYSDFQGPGSVVAAQLAVEDFAKQSAAVPLERGPKPQEVAAAVVYLASARSVTGVTLAVDGGQHLAWDTPDASIAE